MVVSIQIKRVSKQIINNKQMITTIKISCNVGITHSREPIKLFQDGKNSR